MLVFVLGRIVWAALLLVAVTFVLFVLFFLAPGNQLSLSGSFTDEAALDDADGQAKLEQDRPLSEYLDFLGALLRGDLGTSWRTSDDVTWLIGQAIPATASLVVGGMVLGLVVAFVVGIRSAVRPRGSVDRAGNLLVLFGVSAHPVWLGLVLAWLFGFVLGWMPIYGYCDVFRPNDAAECGGPVQWAYHLVLPWIVFAAAFSALYARMLRSGLTDELREDYVTAARARGVGERAIVRDHALRNALLPIVTMLTMDLGIAFSATLFIETIFRIPGLGFLVVNAIPRRDLPVLLGVTIVVSVIIILTSLLLDLLYARVDPRNGSPALRRASADQAR
ncbi:MAG: ABC transporter permease [Gaiella sp.]